MSQADAQFLAVPARLRDALIEGQGEGAREWCDRMPGLVADLLARWSCVIAGPVMCGWAGVVVPVRRVDGSGAMLKISHPHETRRLAVPAPSGLPRMQPTFEQWAIELPAMSAAAGHPLPARAVDAAVATCVELGAEQPDTIQHGDLNQSNVLRGTRQDWLAIDPQGLSAKSPTSASLTSVTGGPSCETCPTPTAPSAGGSRSSPTPPRSTSRGRCAGRKPEPSR
ncbi:aminoglycoside phosphotransferase family protein [Actinopolymorpha sp. B9G3]|uniref:aminoglycoside phosphotransferase family protein n=1 Tax=Actinopolymorpha sp. B9G3 TaxID=3158970 RepID=UPI0032D8D0B2